MRVDVRASGSGACSAAHIIFIRLAIKVYEVLQALPLERWPAGATGHELAGGVTTEVRGRETARNKSFGYGVGWPADGSCVGGRSDYGNAGSGDRAQHCDTRRVGIWRAD